MTSPAHTVEPEAAVPNVARLLAGWRVRRLFVVDGGRLVGVVARRDLLRGFLRSDQDIREEIEREVLGRVLWTTPGTVSVVVDNGMVTLSGRLEYQAEVDIAGHLVKAIPGVVNVRNLLEYQMARRGRPSQRSRTNRLMEPTPPTRGSNTVPGSTPGRSTVPIPRF